MEVRTTSYVKNQYKNKVKELIGFLAKASVEGFITKNEMETKIKQLNKIIKLNN